MAINTETVTDADGNAYQTVRIGNQIWTAKNLSTTRFNDGTSIPLVKGKEYEDEHSYGNCWTPAYCWYDNDIRNKEKYGALYNWATVNTGKLAPKGWHVPTDEEWMELEAHLILNGYNADGTKQGNKIAKSLAASTDWGSVPNPGAIGNDFSKNNWSRFSALPSGWLDEDGFCYGQGEAGYWWSATDASGHSARYVALRNDQDNLWRDCNDKRRGFSVRLLLD